MPLRPLKLLIPWVSTYSKLIMKTTSYRILWKGQITGPFGRDEIEEMLSRNEILSMRMPEEANAAKCFINFFTKENEKNNTITIFRRSASQSKEVNLLNQISKSR